MGAGDRPKQENGDQTIGMPNDRSRILPPDGVKVPVDRPFDSLLVSETLMIALFSGNARRVRLSRAVTISARRRSFDSSRPLFERTKRGPCSREARDHL